MNRSSSSRASRALALAAAIVLIALVVFTANRAARDALEGSPEAAAAPDRPSADLRDAPREAGAVRAAASAPAPPAQAADPANPGAILRGVVFAGPAAEPLAGVAVGLVRHQLPFRTTVPTDDEGRFEFLELPPGVYRVCVDPRSLPEGVMPPWDQIDGPSYGDEGFGPVEVRLEAGAEHEVRLRCFFAARIVGRVVTRTGERVAGAWLRAQSKRAGYQGLNADLGGTRGGVLELAYFPPAQPLERSDDVTDETGYFELVDVYPSTYEMMVQLTDRADEAHRSLSLPMTEPFVVAEGTVVDVGDFRLGAGDRSLRGVVLDAWDDEPFADLSVLCYEASGNQGDELATVRTDAFGRFAMKALPATSVKVLAGPMGAMHGTGKNVLAQHAQAVRVDLDASTSEIELEPIRVWRSRPFHVRARVAAPLGSHFDPDDWFVDVVCPGHTGRMPCDERASWDEEREWFSWACEPPHESVAVRLRAASSQRGPGGSDVIDEITVTPRPDELREIELRIR